jgi:protein involved in polysaccharide export with SLBB domain
MVNTRFALQWRRAAAFLAIGLVASGMLSLSVNSSAQDSPQVAADRDKHKDDKPEHKDEKRDADKKGPEKRHAEKPEERKKEKPEDRGGIQPDSDEPLPGSHINSGDNHTVVFPSAVARTPRLDLRTPVDFRLPTPGTGAMGGLPTARLPLFGWNVFASARAMIDARRAYYARFANTLGAAAAGTISPFAGTFQNGGSDIESGLAAGGGGVPGGVAEGGSIVPLPQPLSTPVPQGTDQTLSGASADQGQGQGQGNDQSGNPQGGASDQTSLQGQGQNTGTSQPIGSLPQALPPNLPGSGAGPGIIGGDSSGQGSTQTTSIPFGNRVLDPSHTIVSPEELARFPVSMPAPERYQLGPGDVLQITIQSPTYEARSFSAEVDNRGRILVPIIGKPMVVRGLTLTSLEAALRTEIRPALTNVSVIVTLAELRTLSIAILGESYAPGTYLLPPTLTLFNALYASGGPTMDGSMRNILLRRANGFTKRFDLYKEFVTGDVSEDVPLLPGDIIYIPPADGHVVVTGEVRRPATYEIRGGEHLRDVLRYAGGAKPTGIAQKVAIESVRPGSERVLVDASLVGLQSSNPPIYSGDTIDLYSIRNEVMNAVTVEGAVQTPREYAMSSGMTVADLIESARGLTRDAYPDRADLFRQNPDKTDKLIRIDLRQALARNPDANVKLKPFDHIIVYTFDEVRSLGNRTVTVAGAVQRPGSFYRADNMSVRDILLEAGGLQPNAYMDTAFIQRTNPDGTPGELVKLNLNKLLSGNTTENLPLQNLDVLTVETVQEANFIPDDQVQIVGAVQRPGVFTRGSNMKVSDLLKLSGGTVPDASLDRAFLQRLDLDGRVGPLVVVDLKGILNGDPGSDVPLKTKDTLFIYTKNQAQFQPPQEVTIHGAVLNPGIYSRAPGMHLKDVLMLAGGKTPTSSATIEIAKARVPDGTPVQRYNLNKVLAGDPASNVALDDGDMISLPEDSSILVQPLVVRILGQVQNPGSYLVTSRTTRLSDLIKRAGGLKPNAFPQGSQFFRDVVNLYSKPSLTLTPHIVALLKEITSAEYDRDLARGDIDKIRAVIQAQSANSSIPIAVGTTGVASTSSAGSGALVTQATRSRDPVTPARTLARDDLEVLGNLNVDLPAAMAHPNGRDDLYVMDGDSVTIPEKPVNIQIIGAVVAPAALMFRPGMTLGAYLENAGGFTADAARDQVLIIRESGNVRHADLGTKLLLGDVVFIPTKVMIDRLRDKQADFNSAINTITTAGILLAVVSALTK